MRVRAYTHTHTHTHKDNLSEPFHLHPPPQAMNRSLANVIFGGYGNTPGKQAAKVEVRGARDRGAAVC